MKIISILLFLLMPLALMATHNRGGEITYKHLFGLTYEITITTCTKSSSVSADRDELELDFGDGDIDTIPRTLIETVPGEDAQKNYYVTTHTYSGPGLYTLCMEDPNRNGGIINIGGGQDSENIVFAIQTTLNTYFANNNSVSFEDCPCPEIACVNYPYCYNPNAIDVDGDSLVYELVAPYGENCSPLLLGTSYFFPSSFGGTISLDQQTGDFCWTNPTMIGEFNIAIKIWEFRNGFPIGFVLRDIQITVQGGCSNELPIIDPLPNLCVVAGESISVQVEATDPDGDVISLSATGQPLTLSPSPATFPTAVGTASVQNTFDWLTDCSQIRLADYQLFFRAEDNGNPSLSKTEVMNVKVIPPSININNANALGNSITIDWQSSTCANLENYNVYRSNNPIDIPSDNCCYNVDLEDYNFELVGTTGNGTTTYTDNDNLSIGNLYCYVVTSIYNNGTMESCPSDTTCASLKRDVPLITNVSIITTDNSSGQDSIIWASPTELDTIANPGPYLYKILYHSGFSGTTTLLNTTPANPFLGSLDTTYFHSAINTFNEPHSYIIELYRIVNGVESLIGGTNKASSIYLTTFPQDNAVDLSWTEVVPWINYEYEVYRADVFSGPFVMVGTSTTQEFTDTGLLNGKEYCYYVKSIGEYSIPGVANPLFNKSQIACETPVDMTPPCSPVLTIEPDCVDEISLLTWTNPNNNCSDDATRYTIYYSATEIGEYSVIGNVGSDTDTMFSYSNNGSIAGCYYVTATDSLQYNNESLPSNAVCIDNCPIYFLPNVFTPNGDGLNDFFTPILPYKYVQDIDLTIYNRWGQPVHKTTDPMIRWNGMHFESGADVPDGVYYYVCIVNTIRLEGIVPIELTGSFHVSRGNGSGNGN